jgi:signal peptide peptidase SppA
MKYAHILLAVASEPWAMLPEKLLAMLDLLRLQASGVKFSSQEIDARITKARDNEVAKSQGAVAILPLRGVIANRMNMMSDISGGTSAEKFALNFSAALADDQVKAIVIDVDSPGGTVSGTDELSQLIYESRGPKPIVAHVNATGASAAYWIASAADEVVVTPSGQVGSVGVFSAHDDVSKMMDELGVKTTLIAAKGSPYKVEGNPYEPLGDDARDYMQGRVDEAYGNFVKALARNRNVAQSHVNENFGKGRMVTAENAVEQGMADKVGTLHETLQRFGSSLYPPSPTKRQKSARAFAHERERRALDL